MNVRKAMVSVLAPSCITLAALGWVSQAGEANKFESRAGFTFPRIKGYGKVVQLPDAVDQPRDGSKICVDITAGGSPKEINPAIEKVARFVNIYAGAGKQPANARITVILHGKATLAALNNESYAKQWQVDRNPNIPLFKTLKEAGVEFLVCGQSLVQKGGRHKDVTSEVRIAVSALTINVNRQLDGFAFIPLH
jgi:intracellular sulfur oxidation DsrE/DsrF family protein